MLKDFAKTEVTTETKIEDHLAALQIEMIDRDTRGRRRLKLEKE